LILKNSSIKPKKSDILKFNKKKVRLLVLFAFFISLSISSANLKNSITINNSSLAVNDIIGEDNRIRVNPTTSYPWSAIVKLYINWEGFSAFGTGAMIDKNHVLTAAHCVYSQDHGGWVDSIKVVPGANNGNEPFGHAWAINIRCYYRWIDYEYSSHDFAVITLDRDIGLQTGWMGLYNTFPLSSIYTGEINTAGYPYDLDNGQNMYYTSGNGYSAHEYSHSFDLDVEGGQSGSPVWIYDGTDYYILSVVTSGRVGINFGTRINWNKFDCINNWLTADEYSVYKADLRFESNTFAGFTPEIGAAGLTDFNVWCKVINVGIISPGPFTVSYYASTDTTISTEDYLIGTDTIPTLSPTESVDSQWSGILPTTIPNGSYYVGWILDVNDNIDEFNENNNCDYIWDYKLQIDYIPPANPTSCDQLNGTTTSNVWQNEVENPSFNWTDSFDSGRLEGYYYYWGLEPNGTSSSFSTTPEFDPPEVESGEYYLRVKVKDIFGNNASWATLYIFKYDGTAPENPTTCDQLVGTTESGVWQNSTNNPFFVWNKGLDHHIDVAGYYYYWGTAPYGTSDAFTTHTSFDSPQIFSTTWYLRVSTVDVVGNRAPWKTLYVFKYEQPAESDDPRSSDNPININDILIYAIIILSSVFCCELIWVFKKRERR
jgi:glutamyl endopeptidase